MMCQKICEDHCSADVFGCSFLGFCDRIVWAQSPMEKWHPIGKGNEPSSWVFCVANVPGPTNVCKCIHRHHQNFKRLPVKWSVSVIDLVTGASVFYPIHHRCDLLWPNPRTDRINNNNVPNKPKQEPNLSCQNNIHPCRRLFFFCIQGHQPKKFDQFNSIYY